jgi:hypothetical protein
MGRRLAILRAGDRTASEVASHSREALDRPLAHPGELWTAIVRDDALLIGAFQRARDLGPGEDDATIPPVPRLRRGSGGPSVRVGPGTVHVALSLSRPDAMTACDEKRIVNRAVRPLLRALTKIGALAHFFGRDWVSVHHRPAAWVGFAHDASTRRTLFEAFVAVRTPFAVNRPSFLGKPPGALDALVGAVVDPRRLVDALVQAYTLAWDAEAIEVDAPAASLDEGDVFADPPWASTVDEAIGRLGAGFDAGGRFRVGGDLLVSRDALARLEARVAEAGQDDVARVIDETLTAPGVALDGVRSLTSVRDLVLRARRE